MGFEKGNSYYGYTEEDYNELINEYGVPSNLFFQYTYQGQDLYWINIDAVEDFDFGMISASWMAIYGTSGQAFKPL